MLRFTPSPTGDMDIGNLRIAILNYLVSQQQDKQFLIRIEDTDVKHNIEGKDTEIMQILEKFALKHDSVFHQSEHLNLYQTLGVKLLKEKKAFVCKCNNVDNDNCSENCEELTSEEYSTLKVSKEKFVIRIKKSPNMEDFVILKTEGTPTYNFACATDDMMSNIDFVIRDEKYLIDTPKQIHIKNLLGYDQKTTYVHIPTILDLDESASLQSLFEQGFIPDAILNYLLLLGNANTPKEIFTLPQAIKWFDLNNISKSPSKFDMTKLRFINREHLKLMDDRKLSTLFGFADADIGKLAKVYLAECSTINELEAKIHDIFTAKNFDGKWGKEMKTIKNIIYNAPAFETFDKLTKHITTQSDLKDENLFEPLRYLLTNTGDGPELNAIYPFIKSYILEVAS
ncbi:MAG TPA: glutamate--tRNA ligase [Campylobacterales bacterium]|nr:glutamate--tRNA ligase [Campylobacterales bacterium]